MNRFDEGYDPRSPRCRNFRWWIPKNVCTQEQKCDLACGCNPLRRGICGQKAILWLPMPFDWALRIVLPRMYDADGYSFACAKFDPFGNKGGGRK